MTTELSPRELIASLDIVTIDAAIEDLNEELNALRQLRKVALAKNGQAPATSGRGKSTSASASKPGTEERLGKAIWMLEKWGPLSFSKLAERVECRGPKRWFLRALENDARFLIEGETISLAPKPLPS